MSISQKIKSKYLDLRKELDSEVKELEKMHYQHLNCKKGCSHCCLSFKVFPVEFEVIRSEFVPTMILQHQRKNGANLTCPFLIDNSCMIYESRPFICRTHGLPLLHMDDEEWVLSYCELNFKHVPEDYFNTTRFHEQDRLNSRLYILNQMFLESKEGSKYIENELISLGSLLE